jgi:hypothetical protein
MQPGLRPTARNLVLDLMSQLDTSEERSYEWDEVIPSLLRSRLLALHLAPSPELLQGDQQLTVTNEDLIVT